MIDAGAVELCYNVDVLADIHTPLIFFKIGNATHQPHSLLGLDWAYLTRRCLPGQRYPDRPNRRLRN